MCCFQSFVFRDVFFFKLFQYKQGDDTIKMLRITVCRIFSLGTFSKILWSLLTWTLESRLLNSKFLDNIISIKWILGLSAYVRENLQVARKLALMYLDCSYKGFPFSLLNAVNYVVFLYRVCYQDCSLLDRISNSSDMTHTLIYKYLCVCRLHVKWIHHSNATDVAGINNRLICNKNI